MKESFVRTMEAFIAIGATYMVSVTMVQTTLYNKILTKISDSVIGPAVEPYMPYFNISIVILALFLSFSFWRKGNEIGLGRLFNLNMLLFFPSVLDFSTFNWVGLIFDLRPSPGVTALWVFLVGLILQVSYLMLRYTVRFRYVREELRGRGADIRDIDDITRGQVGYLVLLSASTAVLTGGIYFVLPYITNLTISPLEELPIPHILVGFLVVVLIAVGMIMYLKSNSD